MKSVKIILSVILLFFLSSVSVYAAETWHDVSFGGSAEVTEPDVTWYSDSFGGSAAVLGWGNWSIWWNITYINISPPSSFSCSSVDNDSINISWVLGGNSSNTTVIRKKGSSPTGVGDGTSICRRLRFRSWF